MPVDLRPGARCHLCGRVMLGGLCPVCDSSPYRREDHGRVRSSLASWLRLHRMLLGTLLVVLAGLVVAATLGLPHALASRLDERAASRPSPAPRSPAPAARAPAAGSAILAVNAPTSDWDTPSGPSGYAFAVRSSSGSSVVLTDYHLLVAAYLTGERTVTLADGGHTLTGRVVAVSPEPHVARIIAPEALATLSVARAPARLGDRVTVGVAGGGGAVSGRVVTYRGPGGSTHLAFTAEVPPGLDGAPVLDADGHVVGIAEPTEQFPQAGGIGFAVPIAAACAAVGC